MCEMLKAVVIPSLYRPEPDCRSEESYALHTQKTSEPIDSEALCVLQTASF